LSWKCDKSDDGQLKFLYAFQWHVGEDKLQ